MWAALATVGPAAAIFGVHSATACSEAEIADSAVEASDVLLVTIFAAGSGKAIYFAGANNNDRRRARTIVGARKTATVTCIGVCREGRSGRAPGWAAGKCTFGWAAAGSWARPPAPACARSPRAR